MRIWSIHPRYLDSKGLVALWRESLLAKNVLAGKTKGYKNHPQLNRFKEATNPIKAIDYYLKHVWEEAKNRNYNFDYNKFEKTNYTDKINLSTGQLEFEKIHLSEKLRLRDKKKYTELMNLINFEIHPLFTLINGDIESWERT